MKKHGRDALSTVDRIVENDHRELDRLNKIINFEEAREKLRKRRIAQKAEAALEIIADSLEKANAALASRNSIVYREPDGYWSYHADVNYRDRLREAIKTNKPGVADKFLGLFGIAPKMERDLAKAEKAVIEHPGREAAIRHDNFVTSSEGKKTAIAERIESLKDARKNNQHLLDEFREHLPVTQKPVISSDPRSPARDLERRPKRQWADIDHGYG